MIINSIRQDRRTVLKQLSAIVPVGSVPSLPALVQDVADQVSDDALDVERLTASPAFATLSQTSKYAVLTNINDHSLDELPHSATIDSYQAQHSWSQSETEAGPAVATRAEYGICDVVLHLLDIELSEDVRRAWYDEFYEVIEEHAAQRGRPLQVTDHRSESDPGFYARIPGREQYDVVFHAGPTWILTIEANDTRRVSRNYESVARDHYDWLTTTDFGYNQRDLPADDRWETVEPTEGYSLE